MSIEGLRFHQVLNVFHGKSRHTLRPFELIFIQLFNLGPVSALCCGGISAILGDNASLPAKGRRPQGKLVFAGMDKTIVIIKLVALAPVLFCEQGECSLWP